MAQKTARIVKTNDVLHGEPRVEGRRVSVRRITSLVEERGLPAKEVATMHDLDVADVYAALTYYHEHREEMTELQRERDDLVQQSLAGEGTTPEELRRERRTE